MIRAYENPIAFPKNKAAPAWRGGRLTSWPPKNAGYHNGYPSVYTPQTTRFFSLLIAPFQLPGSSQVSSTSPPRIPVPVSHWPTASQWSPLHPPHLWHARRPVVNSAPKSQPAQRWWPKMGWILGNLFGGGGVVNIKNIIYVIECITHKHKAQYTKKIQKMLFKNIKIQI